MLGGGVLRAGDSRDAGQPGPHCAAELQDQRVRRGGGDVAGADEPGRDLRPGDIGDQAPAACGPGHHPPRAASRNCRCYGTGHVQAGRPAPAAPRPPPPALAGPRPPHPEQRSEHPGPCGYRNPGQAGADWTRTMIIQSRPAVSKPFPRCGVVRCRAVPVMMDACRTPRLLPKASVSPSCWLSCRWALTWA
jgi:hypothetical protein